MKLGPFKLLFLPRGTKRMIELDCCTMQCSVTKDVGIGEIINLIREYWPQAFEGEADAAPVESRRRLFGEERGGAE